MKTLRGWGGVACTSRDPPQEPHYRDEVEGPSHVQDEISRGELAGLQPGPRSPRRCDGVVVLGSDHCLDARRSGRRGGQRRYSDLAIETALTLRLLYHLPLRQAEGFLHALFGMMRLDLSAPDYTTLSPAQSAFEAPSAIAGPARRGPPSRARQHGSVPRRGR